MKRREGGVIVSSRLGAAGRVFARVCAFVDFVCSFLHIFRRRHHASMLAGHTKKSNPTEV